MRLRDVSVFTASRSLVSSTEAVLREAGKDGLELFVFWSGTMADGVFRATTLHRPRQTCYRGERGLSVRINGDALHEQARWLADHGHVLGVQIHSHPDDAYHSDADDEHAVVTLTGAISVVVPFLGAGSLLGVETRVFRLSPRGWGTIAGNQVSRLLRVED